MADNRSLAEVLASTSEFIFPADIGEQPVTIDSRDASGDTPLHVMAWQNDVEGAQILIAAGADVNAIGDMGYTPLHVAVTKENLPLAALLLKTGARYDLPTELCGTARDEALRRGGQVAKLFANPE